MGQQTHRQEIVEALQYGEAAPRELSKRLGMKLSDVLHHLEHVRASMGRRFIIREAYCTRCDYVFKRRKRLSTPSRCPQCKSERTEGPFFGIQAS